MGYKFLRLGLDVIRLGVSNSYVWRLVFLRLGVVILTYGGEISYVCGLVILTLGG